MQVLEHESAKFGVFDREMSKNHRDRIPNNRQTKGKRRIDTDDKPPSDGGQNKKRRLYSAFNWAEREAMMKPRSVE